MHSVADFLRIILPVGAVSCWLPSSNRGGSVDIIRGDNGIAYGTVTTRILAYPKLIETDLGWTFNGTTGYILNA